MTSRKPPAPTVRVERQAYQAGALRAGTRAVPEECAVAFTYNRCAHAVMMATPADLEDFAVGFGLAEGTISAPSDIKELDIVAGDLGVELRMWINEDRMADYSDRRRFLAGPTGCGLCGLESLTETMRPAMRVTGALQVSPAMIAAAMAALPAAQKLNQETRAIHAAAFWTPDAGLVALREDVGRHNALDKLAGALARQGVAGNTGIVLLTSRVSVEMVQKAAIVGPPILVAVSAPTALAIRTAEDCGMTLIGIARDEDFEIFTHPQRIVDRAVRHVA